MPFSALGHRHSPRCRPLRCRRGRRSPSPHLGGPLRRLDGAGPAGAGRIHPPPTTRVGGDDPQRCRARLGGDPAVAPGQPCLVSSWTLRPQTAPGPWVSRARRSRLLAVAPFPGAISGLPWREIGPFPDDIFYQLGNVSDLPWEIASGKLLADASTCLRDRGGAGPPSRASPGRRFVKAKWREHLRGTPAVRRRRLRVQPCAPPRALRAPRLRARPGLTTARLFTSQVQGSAWMLRAGLPDSCHNRNPPVL